MKKMKMIAILLIMIEQFNFASAESNKETCFSKSSKALRDGAFNEEVLRKLINKNHNIQISFVRPIVLTSTGSDSKFDYKNSAQFKITERSGYFCEYTIYNRNNPKTKLSTATLWTLTDVSFGDDAVLIFSNNKQDRLSIGCNLPFNDSSKVCIPETDVKFHGLDDSSIQEEAKKSDETIRISELSRQDGVS